MIRIRKIDADDDEAEDEIDELHKETFGDGAPMLRPLYGHWWLGAEPNEAPVAFAGYVDLGFPDLNDTRFAREPGVGYLKRCGVLSGFRGGLQRRFLRVREAHAKRLGLTRMITDTTENIASSNNLISAGYKLYTPEEPWAFNNSLYWYKELQ